MRRLTAFLLAAVVMVTIGAVAGEAQTTTTTTPARPHAATGPEDCGLKKLSFLFWPQGHPASAQYNFPAFPTPHVEVYNGTTTTYGNTDFVGYFANTGNAQFAAVCTPVIENQKLKKMASTKSTTSAAVLVCSFPKTAALGVVPSGTTAKMQVVIAKTEPVATIELGASTSTASYNSKYCKVKPPLVAA